MRYYRYYYAISPNAFDGSDGHRVATINALHTHKYQTANFEYMYLNLT